MTRRILFASVLAVLTVAAAASTALSQQESGPEATAHFKVSNCFYPRSHPHRGLVRLTAVGPAQLPADGGVVPLTWDLSAEKALHHVKMYLHDLPPHNYFRPHKTWRIRTMKAGVHYLRKGKWVVPPGWRGEHGSRNGMGLSVFYSVGRVQSYMGGCEMFIPYAPQSAPQS